MLEKINIYNIMFLDIETVPLFPSYDEMDDRLKLLWDKKSSFFRKEDESPKDVYQRSGIYAEFGKIVCISVGHIIACEDGHKLRLKSFADANEKKILSEFTDMLNKFSETRSALLCAHNGKEFDFPYICRRLLINGLRLPETLNISGKKPWEIMHLDTMELWKFGDYKHYTSLDLLTTIFNIPSPKDDIDGSMIAETFWEKSDLKSISTYCQKDVLAIAQLFLRYTNRELILAENIEIISSEVTS